MKKFLEKHHIFYGWLIVAVGILMLAGSYGIAYNCFSLFIKPVSEARGFTRQSFSMCLTIIFLFYMLVSLFSGKLFKRFKIRTLMRIWAIALPAIYFCYSFCNKLWQYYLCSALTGIGVALLSYISFTAIIANWFLEKRGLAVGITFMGSGLGGMIFNALGGQWVAKLGYAATFRIQAVVMACIVIPLVFLVLKVSPYEVGMEPYGAEKHRDEGRNSVRLYGPTFVEATHTLNFWVLIIMALFIGFTTSALAQTIVTRISDMGYDPTYAAGVNAAYLGVLCVFKILLGTMYDRFGMKVSTFLSLCAIILGLTGLYFAQFRVAHAAVVLGAALGCASGTVALPLLSQAACGTQDFPVISGIVLAASSFGGSLAPMFANLVYDKTGSYALALIIAIIMVVIAIGLLLILKQVREDSED